MQNLIKEFDNRITEISSIKNSITFFSHVYERAKSELYTQPNLILIDDSLEVVFEKTRLLVRLPYKYLQKMFVDIPRFSNIENPDNDNVYTISKELEPSTCEFVVCELLFELLYSSERLDQIERGLYMLVEEALFLSILYESAINYHSSKINHHLDEELDEKLTIVNDFKYLIGFESTEIISIAEKLGPKIVEAIIDHSFLETFEELNKEIAQIVKKYHKDLADLKRVKNTIQTAPLDSISMIGAMNSLKINKYSIDDIMNTQLQGLFNIIRNVRI